MENFWALAITGTLVSLLTSYLKNGIENKALRMLIAVLLSFGLGAIAYAFNFLSGSIQSALIQVYLIANTVYLLIVKWLE